MTDFYQEECERYFERTVGIDPSPILDPFAVRLPKGAVVADIGCGSGRDLLWLKQRGFLPFGLERAPGLARLAEKHSGCRVIVADFQAFDFSTLAVDAMLLTGSLVHLERNSLPPFLDNLLKGLKPGGVLSISMKQGSGTRLDDQGRRFFLWQEPELRKVFEDAGLVVAEVRGANSLLETGEAWINFYLKGAVSREG
ncbi:MAG: class I SAM-dependent methyltransferase [Desulfobacteraceae bacterium]|nr:class I SAM-dependent methyltransferase [Desulfobacteraceae bacterium]